MRGAVARAGEAVREAPVLERIGGRPAPRLDIGEDLDGGGEAGGGCHSDAEQDAHDEDHPHHSEHDRARHERSEPRWRTSIAGDVDVGVHDAQ